MENREANTEKNNNKKKKKWWHLPAIAAGSLVALILLLLAVVSCVLTPGRLTRMIRQYGTEYLVNGRVDVARAELTVWSTFPHVELTVDSLAVLNLDPSVPDTVVALERFHGRVNLAALLIGRISVNHVELRRPRAVLFTGTDTLASSLSILPPSDSSEPKSDEPLSLPDIRIDRFEIVGDARLSYISQPDSIDATVVISRSTLQGPDAVPHYSFAVKGNLGALPFLTDTLAYGIDGGIGWNPSEPLAVSLHNFKIEAGGLRTETDLRADFAREVTIHELRFRLHPVELQALAALAARFEPLCDVVPDVKSRAALSVSAELLSPYVVGRTPSPEMKIDVRVADAPLAVPAFYVDFTNLGAELDVRLSQSGFDYARAELKRLDIAFPGSQFTLHGSATRLLSDPKLEGCFKGAVNFNALDRRVWTLLAMRLSGAFDADIDFNLRMSDLSVNNFHRTKLTGKATLRDFGAILPADSLSAGLTRATLEFGSSNRFVRGDFRADSMLMASVSVDSAWVFLPEITARLADLKLGAGVENRASSLDTATVTPMGARLSLRSLRYKGVADSTRAMLRGLGGSVVLTRYKGADREPRIGFRLGMERAVVAAGANRMSLRDGEINMSAFKTRSDKARRKRRRLTAADSLRFAAHRDSILLAQSQYERVDFDVDRSMVTLLRRWNVSGGISAKGGRLITPAWPLRTRMRDLRFTFTPDSLALRSLKLTTGRSDFSLSGSISNVQRALGRRNSQQPLCLRLDLHSDTINVNELVQTAFRGAAADASAPSAPLDLDASDATAEQAADSASADRMMALVIPMNIDAELDFGARTIVYSNMLLHDFSGQVLVANGAANLNSLRASTDIGSAELNMLYYAPRRSDVDFGMNLDLNRFNIGRVTELMPALDSIMPMLRNFGGVVDAEVSATTSVDSMLNIDFPSLKAMVRLRGDSLVVLDPETFRSISKWLLFKDKNKNMIDHMDVRMAVENSVLNLYPFMFDFDRYRIGVMGHNDLNLNLNYHISVLKSPIPFRFGINVKGTMDKMKIRLGRSRFKEDMAAESVALGDTIRLNLAREIKNVFRRGARAARLAPLKLTRPDEMPRIEESTDTLTPADSLYFRQQGLIE